MGNFDFYDDELKKKEDETQRQQQQNNNYGNGAHNHVYAYYGASPVQPQASKSKKALWIVLGCVLLIAVFVVGYIVGHSLVSPDVAILNSVLKTVEENSLYYNESNWEEIKKRMIVNGGTAMLQTIDGYGFLLSPTELYNLLYPAGTSTASFGVSFIKTEVGLYVNSVSYGSGAFLAGLEAGDLVVSATNGGQTYDLRNCTDLTMTAAFAGGWGAKASVNVIRGMYSLELGDTLSVQQIEMTKIVYGTNFVEYYFGEDRTNMDSEVIVKLGLNMLDASKVGYIRINSFENSFDNYGNEVTAAGQFASAMARFKNVYSGKGKLVLDLVDNPGGNVEYAREIAGYLCYDANGSNKKLLVTTLRSRTSVLSTYYTDSKYADYFDVAAEQPQIAVLTNGMSASASELLLGAMLDYGTALHVGTTTYGKGIAQTVQAMNYYERISTSDGYENFPYGIYYTSAMFYTPKNVNKHGVGFVPSEANTASTYAEMLKRVKTLFA